MSVWRFVGAAAQPSMGAAVEVQQLAEAGARLAAPAVTAARAALADETGLLQRELDEAIGQRHGVVAPGEAVEVADVPAGEALPIQAQDALHLHGRRFAARRAHPPTIIAGPPAPPASNRARQRRTLRGSRPRISAACTQLMPHSRLA